MREKPQRGSSGDPGREGAMWDQFVAPGPNRGGDDPRGGTFHEQHDGRAVDQFGKSRFDGLCGFRVFGRGRVREPQLLLQIAVSLHLGEDVYATDEAPVHVELGIRRPLRIRLQPLSHVFV